MKRAPLAQENQLDAHYQVLPYPLHELFFREQGTIQGRQKLFQKIFAHFLIRPFA